VFSLETKRIGSIPNRDGNGSNLLDFAIPNCASEDKTRPIKKPVTHYGFNFMPKPVPIGLAGTHGSLVPDKAHRLKQ
jgi:hypothetical protein